MSKMGEFAELSQIEGLQISSVSADLYENGRDDLVLFYFKEGANYASLQTTNSIISETLVWNQDSNRNSIKAQVVNTKNANTFTGQQGLDSLDEIAKNVSRTLTIRGLNPKRELMKPLRLRISYLLQPELLAKNFGR